MKPLLMFTLSCWIILANAQDTYYVTADLLNVRKSPKANSKVITQLKMGDSLVVYQQLQGWNEVRLNDGSTGFVSSKFVSKDINTNNSDNEGGGVAIFIYLALAALILYIVYRRYSTKCEECGKWNAMKISSETVIERLESHVVKTLRDKDGKGNVIHTKEVTVPATKFRYRVTETCKYCKHETSYITSETKEN